MSTRSSSAASGSASTTPRTFFRRFARVYDRLGSLRDDAAVRPWIAQLTRRVCLDKLAAGSLEEPAGEIVATDAEATIAELDEAFAVREALAGLSEDCREVLDRFFCRDESYRTIGEALAIPPGTIASRISRCLGKLRERFEGKIESAEQSGEVKR